SLQGDMKMFTDSLSPSIVSQDLENNKELALAKLASNQTDLVIVIPMDAIQTIQSNQQAKFIIYHNEVDPFQIAYINSVARIYTDDVNRHILESITQQGQANSGTLQTSLEDAIAKTKSLKQTLPPGDTNTAAQVNDLEKDLTAAHGDLTTFRSLGSTVLVNPF